MNGWNASRDYKLSSAAITGIVTDRVISSVYPITAGGALNQVIKIKTSAATVVGTITVKLQTAIGDDWVDSKTTTIAAAGSVYIKLNIEVVADQTFLPLLNQGRIVLTTTNAGDSVTLSSIEVLQEL